MRGSRVQQASDNNHYEPDIDSVQGNASKIEKQSDRNCGRTAIWFLSKKRKGRRNILSQNDPVENDKKVERSVKVLHRPGTDILYAEVRTTNRRPHKVSELMTRI